MKKILSAIFAIMLLLQCVVLCPVQAQAAETVDSGSCGDNVTWTLNDEGTLTISGTGAMTDYSFSDSPWYDNGDIKSVVIKSGVTTVGSYAFSWCTGITSVSLPSTITSINESAFRYCYNMTSVTIPSNVTSIGDDAFYCCASLTSITIPSKVTSIGETAFFSCAGLPSVTIPASVTDIGLCAFAAGESMTKITVSSSNPNYSSSNGVLFNKNKTTLIQVPGGLSGSYTIPSTVTTIGEQAFVYCSDLTSVTIPSSVTVIDDFAFAECYALQTVTIPNGVTTIGYGAFEYCYGLTSVSIPASVTEIDDEAFAFCDSLTQISVDSANPNYSSSSSSGALFNKDKTKLIRVPGGYTGNYVISSSVTSIEDDAFSFCKNLKSVIIPDSITEIPFCAFYGCENMTAIVIPATVSEIDYAFSWCDNLTNVFYKGTAAQKEAMTIANYNDDLTDAAWHYEVEVTKKNGKYVIYCPDCDTEYNPDGSIVASSLSITTQPKTTYTKSGSTAKVTVKAEGEGLTYQWYVKNAGASKYSKSSITSATYSTKMSSTSKDRAVYCVITDKYGNTVKTSTVYLRMAATVTTQPKTTYTKSGSTAKVTVTAAGDGLTYQWYIKSAGATKFTKSSVTSATYSTKMSSSSKDRQVYCVITDKYGNTAQTNTVYLRMAATVTTQPKTTYTKSGSTAKVTVKAAGDGLTYQWYIKSAGATKFTKSSVTSATYSTKMSSTSKDRQVYCVITDKYGNTVKTNTVYLRMAATITSQPTSVSVASGEKATVKVKAVGDGLTYKWYYAEKGSSTFKLTTSFTGTTYSVTMNDARDGRRVYCVVTDKYGKTVTSNTVTLSMK